MHKQNSKSIEYSGLNLSQQHVFKILSVLFAVMAFKTASITRQQFYSLKINKTDKEKEPQKYHFIFKIKFNL